MPTWFWLCLGILTGLLTGMTVYTLALVKYIKENKMPCGGKRRKRK